MNAPNDRVKQLNQAADQGHADALYTLSCMCRGGKDVKRYIGEGYQLLCRAARRGHIAARTVLSIRDYRLERLSRAADQGDANSLYILGCMYRDGKDVERNLGEALWLMHLAAKQGHVEAQTVLKDLNDRVKRLRQSSGLNADGQYHLRLSDCGEREEDILGALERLEQLHQAADQGDVEAQTVLGDLYHDAPTAQCVAGDSSDAVAVKWYAKAGRRGYARAQFELGNMYGLGHGVEQNYTRMLQWKVRAALNGSLDAQHNLHVLYHLEIGVPDDCAEALRSCRMAAEQGSPWAQCQLAQTYAMGISRAQKDLAESLKWLLRAARQGSSLARNCLENPFHPRTWQAELQEYRHRCQELKVKAQITGNSQDRSVVKWVFSGTGLGGYQLRFGGNLKPAENFYRNLVTGVAELKGRIKKKGR